jgi:long-subunit fatty acid transport protein
MAVNLYDQSLIPGNEWTEKTRGGFWTTAGTLLSTGNFLLEQRYRDFEGKNYTFGVLWKPTDRLSLGGVYHTAWAADVDYTGIQIAPFPANVIRQSRRLEFPPAWAVGVSYRFPGDHLTVALDVTRRNWDDFVEIVKWPRSLRERRTSPVTGLEKWRSPHDATYTVRLGAEYVFFDPDQPLTDYLWSLRGGLMYDEAPAGGGHFLFSDGLQSYFSEVSGDPDPFYGVSVGAGVLIKNRVNVDFAYQYRWGRDVRKDTFLERGVEADTDQHAFYLSTVIYF